MPKHAGVGSAAACCDLCKGTAGCVKFVFHERLCVLKSAAGAAQAAAGYVSGHCADSQ
jgi:hypothetical protein